MSEQVIRRPPLSGPKILLIGPSGAGKTYALGTLADWAERSGKRMFVLFVEQGLETLLGYWADRGKHIPTCLAYHSITTKALPLEGLLDAAKKVGMLSYENLTKSVDPSRGTNNPYEKILQTLANLQDDRTGKTWGNISNLTNGDIFCIDSLSELANACMKMVTGNRPTASPSDYGVAQNNLLNLLRFMTQSLQCTLVLTAHVQRQQDEITGGIKLMTKAIGKAMGDDIPQLFSEVIGCVRTGAEWTWDTAHSSLDTKTRYLPVASKLPPDFGPIMDKWAKRAAA